MVLRAGLEGLACALITAVGVGLRDWTSDDSEGSSCLDEWEGVKAGAMVTKDLPARERPA